MFGLDLGNIGKDLSRLMAIVTTVANKLSLQEGDLDVWMTFLTEPVDEGLLHEYGRLIDDEERRYARRFRLPRDQQTYLVTRVLVRTVLSRYAFLAPEHWRFKPDQYGRPHIVNDADLVPSGMTFNVSHTGGLIVLALTRRGPLGVDAENSRERPAPLDLASRFLAGVEAAQLQATPANRQSDHFYECWTLKESYIKARGLGLSIPLDQFSFEFRPEHTIHMRAGSALCDRPSRWQFWQFRPSADHISAICAARDQSGDRKLTFRVVMPLVMERKVAPDLLRKSD